MKNRLNRVCPPLLPLVVALIAGIWSGVLPPFSPFWFALVGATNQHSQNKHNLNKRYLGVCAENRNDASAVIARAVWVCAHEVHLRRNVAGH